MAVSLGGIGALVGGGSALAGLFGVGTNQPPTPPPPAYMPASLPGADQGAYSGIGALPNYNTAAGALPYAQNTFQNLYNNPYAGLYQGLSNNTAGVGYGAGSNLVGAGQSYLPYAQQTLQTGFDPQNALYNQQFQLQTDQDRASQAARGIATTPYGAGVENQANQLFNLNWQNAQLGRQATAANTASMLTNSAGGATTTGLNTMNAAGALPYGTANTIGGNQNSAIGAYGGFGTTAMAPMQQQIADYLQYLQLGNQSAGVNNQQYANQLTGQNQQFNQNQILGKNLGSSISGLGTYFGGGNGVSQYSSSGNPVTYTNIGGYNMPTYT